MKSSFKIFAWSALALIGVIAIATALYFYQRGNASKNPLAGIVNVAVDIGDQRFMRWHTPRDLPAITFQDEAGKEMSLTAFRGKVVLLNIWATWCPPCREEMPSLDRLNDKRGGEHFEVVALSIDRDTALVKPFSGSAARAMLIETMQTHGVDSFAALAAATIQGSTETTFYVLAVYFGAVGIQRARHAVACALLAELAGVVAAIVVCYRFFG